MRKILLLPRGNVKRPGSNIGLVNAYAMPLEATRVDLAPGADGLPARISATLGRSVDTHRAARRPREDSLTALRGRLSFTGWHALVDLAEHWSQQDNWHLASWSRSIF